MMAALFLCSGWSVAPLAQACDSGVVGYDVVADGVGIPLCGGAGNAARGREIVAGRQGNCLACHTAPIPEQAFHGDIGPPLHGVGLRRTEATLRLQVIDAAHFNAETVMPSFHRIDGLVGVREDRVGQPLLTAAEGEDVIAYLLTLTGPLPQD